MKLSFIGLFLLLVLPAIPAMAADFVIDSANSSVSVDVKASPPHSFTCDLQSFEASIQIDPKEATVTAAEFSFQLTDLETHNDSRNEKMHKWMDVENHNTIRWKMISMEMAGDELVAYGELTMHGTSLPVAVSFTKLIDDSGCVLKGQADFNYMDFGLPKIRLFLFTVKPELHVNFELRGALAENN